MGVPKLPRTSAKRWPFRKTPTIVALFSTVLVLLVAIEWNLLQSTHDAVRATTDGDPYKKGPPQSKNVTIARRFATTNAESSTKMEYAPLRNNPSQCQQMEQTENPRIKERIKLARKNLPENKMVITKLTTCVGDAAASKWTI